MGIAAWVREKLWRADNWCAELITLRSDLASEPKGPQTAEKLVELGDATAYIDPDRGRALSLYVEAWRAGHSGAGDKALTLATTLRAHMTRAEIAVSMENMLAAGAAFLDAGFPELATEPLQKFANARPQGANAVGEAARLESVRPLLAIASHHKFDGEKEVAEALARAQGVPGANAAPLFIHAIRLARLANLPEKLPALLAAASRSCGDDDTIAAQIELRLFEANDADTLLAHYRSRFEKAPTRAAYVERVRSAGVELIARGLQPGLGLRLLRMSLEHAYDEKLPTIASHIAAWELLIAHAKAQHSTVDMVPLIVSAMAAPLSDDDAVYLSRLGLEIVWRDAGDTLAAQPYAAMALDFVPDHPLALEFIKVVEPSAMSAALAAATTPMQMIELVELPPEPQIKISTPTTKMPVLSPAPIPAPAPVASTVPAKSTSRIPVFDQGQVKRAEAPASMVTPSAKRIGGRLALLTPPPPRTTTLKRDVSPFPVVVEKSVPPGEVRAKRVVVPIDCVVELPDASFFSTVLRDVSTSGAHIVTKRKLEMEVVVTLEMRIPGPNPASAASFTARARVARRTDVGYGLQYVDPPKELVAAIDAATKEV
ncbi:MAG TPA: PilZ domain-containing protein [Kofleriaceae bacterium]|jgi:hypothetical protein